MATPQTTSAEPGATFDDRFLVRTSAKVFATAGDTKPADISSWLQEFHHFQRRRVKNSATDFARLERGGSIVTIYHSGTIQCQGSDPWPAVELLASLVDDEPKPQAATLSMFELARISGVKL